MTADSYTKVVLVTGANQGIGYGLVRLLAERGHIVYLGARNPELGTQAVKQLKDEHGLEAHFIHLDVTDSSLIAAAKERIEKEQGRLDVLVNNAAVACEFIPPSQSKHTEYRYSFETNFFAVIELTTALMPLIRKATPGYGSIINVTSGLGSNSGRAGPEANQAYNGIVTTKLNGYRAGTTPLEAAELFVPWALVGPEDDDKTCRFESEGIPKGW
uniref:Short-chain dehydrogenase reductase sdr n=1 Tax=Moniliophthora roreri TaxID=221103 RepID=A0A0W0G4Q5_MONRR